MLIPRYLLPFITIALVASIQGCGTSVPAKSSSQKSITNQSGDKDTNMKHVDLSTFQMINAEDGWGIGQGKVWTTDDGGSSWNNASPHFTSFSTKSPIKLFALNKTTAWVLQSDATSRQAILLRTTTSGKTWRKSSIASGGAPESLHFQNSHEGWLTLIGPGTAGNQSEVIYGTSNSGQSWTKLASISTNGSLPIGGDKTGVSFQTLQRGWATGALGANGHIFLYSTRNRGTSWSMSQLRIPPSLKNATFISYPPLFFNGQSALLPVKTGSGQFFLYRTSNGGSSWKYTSFIGDNSSQNQILTWSILTKNIAFATNGSQLFVTSTSGEKWSSITPNVSLNNIKNMQFLSKDNGWILMKNGSILRTTDGGRNWMKLQ